MEGYAVDLEYIEMILCRRILGPSRFEESLSETVFSNLYCYLYTGTLSGC